MKPIESMPVSSDELIKFKELVFKVKEAHPTKCVYNLKDASHARALRRRFYRLRESISPFDRDKDLANSVVFSVVGRMLIMNLKSDWTKDLTPGVQSES